MIYKVIDQELIYEIGSDGNGYLVIDVKQTEGEKTSARYFIGKSAAKELYLGIGLALTDLGNGEE